MRDVIAGSVPYAPTATGRGMEQFHHPRPVALGRGGNARPTAERRRLLAGLSGRVVEIGAGDGQKLLCYPAEVEEITIVEQDPFLRAAAEIVAKHAPLPVRTIDADPARLPIPDHACDAVVCSLVLCRMPHAAATLAEVKRILRPAGELRFYEHQRSSRPVVSLAQSLLSPIWSRAFSGCHPDHDVLSLVERAGLTIHRLDRFPFHHVGHVLGVATAP